jgi:hypothetical protein
MGYYYGIDAIWRTTGGLLGGLSHDIFGFSFTFTLGGTFYIISAMISFRKFRNLKIN